MGRIVLRSVGAIIVLAWSVAGCGGADPSPVGGLETPAQVVLIPAK